MAEDTVIIDLEINDQQATNAIKQATAELVRLKEEQKKLNDEYKAGKKTREEYAAGLVDIKKQMTAASDTIKANEKVLKDNAKAAKEADGSLNQMRTQLKDLQKQWAALSATERDSARGKEILDKMQSLNTEVSDLEHKMGDWHRQVGHYEQALLGMTGPLGAVANLFKGLSGGTMQLSVAFKNGAQAVAAFGKQLLALLANPIVAAIAAIVVVVMKLVDAFKKSDDAMTSLSTAMAAFQPIVSAVGAVLEKVAEVLGKVALAAANAVTAVLKLIPGFKDAQQAAQDYEQSLDKLQDTERTYTVESAKNNRDIAELRAKASETDKYTAEQRLEFLQQARTLEEKNLKAEKDIAAERLRLARQKAKQDNDTSDETKNRLAELEAAMYQAEENFYQGIRRLDRQAASARNEIAQQEAAELKERQQRYKEYLQRRREMEETARQWSRAYEDARIEAIADMQQKSEEALRVSYARQIEDLKKTLATEKNLTQQARADIQALIILKEAEMQTKLGEMRKKWADEAAKGQMDAFKKAYSDVMDTYMLDYKKMLQDAGTDVEAAARAAVTYAEQVRDQLKGINNLQGEERAKALQAMGMSETQYAIAMVEAEDAVTAALARHGEALKAVADAAQLEQETEVKNAQKSKKAYIDMAATVTGSLADMMNELAGDNEQMQGFLKAIAMANVAANTAASIAGAVNAAVEAGGFTGPAAMVTIPTFIATLVATVTAAIAQTASLLKKADAPKAPKFAEGGLVEGPGTGTSDSIHARLSNGESVMTAKATMAAAPLLSAINQMYGGAPIGDNRAGSADAMRDMMLDVMAEVRPVVSVKEITRVQNRVTAKELIAKK